MTTWLRKDKGYKINPKRIERLYKLLGLSALGPKPNTSKRGKGERHRVYKYLLRNLKVDRPNQVSLSNTMTSEWCRQTVQEAVEQYGNPEILNTDQGSQFTSLEFCDWVTHPDQGIQLSMDGKGRAIDNVFVERLWRSVKYEHVYLFSASDGLECFNGLKSYFEYYNNQRRHQSLDYETPARVYKQALKKVA